MIVSSHSITIYPMRYINVNFFPFAPDLQESYHLEKQQKIFNTLCFKKMNWASIIWQMRNTHNIRFNNQFLPRLFFLVFSAANQSSRRTITTLAALGWTDYGFLSPRTRDPNDTYHSVERLIIFLQNQSILPETINSNVLSPVEHNLFVLPLYNIHNSLMGNSPFNSHTFLSN